MNKFDWDFCGAEELFPHVEHLAMAAVRRILDTPSFTLERKYGEIFGVMSLLNDIKKDIDQFKKESEEGLADFKRTCAETGKAYEKLFGDNPEWKKPENNKTEAPHGTDT